MTYKLFLDDVREAPDETWITARNTNEAKKIIEKNGFPTLISFDHDLGLDDNQNELDTGYDFAKWIVEMDMESEVLTEDFKFIVHSANPIGARNIVEYLSNYLRLKKGAFK